jgi:deoxyribonuclease-4
MNIGAHVRGGGTLIPSLAEGVALGADSIQIFTQSPRMWKPSLYSPEVLAAFREAQAQHPTVRETYCHATYLINLATADNDLFAKSVATLTHNLAVGRGMGAKGVILHVGSHKGGGFEHVITQIADAFRRALDTAERAPRDVEDCPILIENAAGAGGTVGRSLDEIEALIDACGGDERLGLCIDTQHLWASGVDYSTVEGTNALIADIDRRIGIERLRCLHLNDSKIELGGNRDRHANIDEGTIGSKGLAPLLGHPAVRDLPLLLEVPGDGDGPRAQDVTQARRVLAAGIALYDGTTSGKKSGTTTRVVTKESKKPAGKTKSAQKASGTAAAGKKNSVRGGKVETMTAKKVAKKTVKAPATKAAATKVTAKSAPTKTTTAPVKKAAAKKVSEGSVKKSSATKVAPKKTAKKKA